MCYAITIKEDKIEKLGEKLGKAFSSQLDIKFNKELYKPYYFVSGFSFPELPIVIAKSIELFQWGLIPSWVKDTVTIDQLRSNTLNARSETVFEKPSFRKAIVSQRCIVPVNGFVEWQTVDKDKIPYFIKPNNSDLFLFGGLYDTWINPNTHEKVNTFSIITTDANPLMAEIHNTKKRMPFILENSKLDAWLDNLASKDTIQSLFNPYDENLMTAYKISKEVNSSKNNRNVPGILNPIEIAGESQLSLF
jgi:putative SOS response-associated peptidase YedK